MQNLSSRISQIKPSLTLAIDAKAKEMIKKGEKVIPFAAGETDFDTPDFIKNEAISALQKGFTRYTPVSGIPELKEAIRDKFKKDNNLDYPLNQIIVSNGAKHTLYNIIQVLCEKGDEVIIPAPYWLSYPAMVLTAGATPVYLETADTGFKVDPKRLAAAITPRTKLFIFNNPSNPTGACSSRKEIEAVASVLADKNLWIISDEIYETLVYGDEPFFSIANVSPGLMKKTIVVNGLSKSSAMTGWRIGYAAGDPSVISAMDTLQSHSTSNPVSFAQKGAVVALRQGAEFSAKLRTVFRERRDLMFDRLSRIPGLETARPEGAFYAFPGISGLIGKSFKGRTIDGSLAFCECLLDDYKVAAVPGSVFGADKFFRISYATSVENINEGLDRLARFVKDLA